MKKSLPMRLYAGISLAVVMVLVVATLTVVSLEKQEEDAKWVTHSVSVLEKTRDIRHQLMQMRGARNANWVTGQNDYLGPYQKGMTIIPSMLDALKEQVRDNPVQTLNIVRLDTALSSLLAYWAGDGKFNATSSREQVANITHQEERRLAQIYQQFEEIKAEEERLLIEREGDLRQRNTITRTFIIGGISLLMVVVLILVNAVVATLKSRIRAGNRLQASLADMEKVNELAEEKNWVLTGLATITNSIQSIDGSNDLSKDIIESVVSYMGLPAGAIYLSNEDETVLQMSSAVAVAAEANTTFKVAEGIVGNAALKRDISIIRNIPDDYWRIESAMGTTSGKGQIACLPLWVAESLKGVIELGSLNEFTAKQLMLLEALSTPLATAIHTRQSRLRITKLLDTVQEQKEAMLNQQEELRQTNEELTRQTQELQASEEELKTQEEELRQINTELIEKNGAAENARQALQLKGKELEATSKYKSEFLANMSHELRTPLNSVLILAKLLADNNPKNLTEKQIEYAKIIHRSGSDLLQLINDILDLSKIEAGKVELLVEDVPLAEIVSDMKQLFSVVATEKEIHFDISIAEGVPAMIRTDKQRVEQVLKNLLSNAFKFTPRAGSVVMEIANRDLFGRQRICISVIDSGIGISSSQQQLIFEAFQQADGSTSRQYGGTGLGLSISKELVKLLGGVIELKSEEGKGSNFSIILPHVLEVSAQPSTASAAPFPVASTDGFTEQEKVEDDRKTIQENERTILIIEDDVNFATILKDFARDKGYKVIVALKGDEGLAYAKKYRPGAIILDIQLPVIDGWSLLRIIKADEQLKNIPVHIISAFDDNRLYTAGALAYVKKPVDREGLEKAFSAIGIYLNSNLKKVLIVSETHFKDDSLKELFRRKQHDLSFDQVNDFETAAERLKQENYGCVIANIGKNVSAGIAMLQQFQETMREAPVPVIIYLDADISAADEMNLKKISDVIVRNSPSVDSRLKDELELFLFKLETGDQRTEEQPEPDNGVNDRSLAGKKVLVVDDDMRNVFALTNVLETQEMEVIAAPDGREAVNIVKNDNSIDLVLMDIMMPEMDGYQAMEMIRKELNITKLPIIALTAKAMSGDREKCIEAGASDYITKPVDTQKLLSLMRVWLAD